MNLVVILISSEKNDTFANFLLKKRESKIP